MAPMSSTSIKIRFRIPHELDHFPPGLTYSLRYKSEFNGQNDWISEKLGNLPSRDKPCYHRECELENGENHVFLEDLLPYGEYTVQIKLLSAVANASDDRMWSDVAVQRNRTLPSIPTKPPTTVFGGFEMVDVSPTERNIFVYWKQINPFEKNGPDFHYSVVSQETDDLWHRNGRSHLLEQTPSKVTESYASFIRLSSSATYRVTVLSVNSQGSSLKNNSMIIPSNEDNQLHMLAPLASTKIVYNDTLFEISWLPPAEPPHLVTSYTIFWCLDKEGHDRPYKCVGNLDWKVVDATHRSVNITLPTNHVYQFAVAANSYETISSGMVWTTCTVLHDKVLGRLKPVAVEKLEATRMLISWNLDCSDRVGVVTGYQISYCAIPSPDVSSSCISNSEMSHDMLNLETTPDSNRAWIPNLQPWTYYKVAVLVKTRGGSSKLSEFSVNRTDPSMPEEGVRHLRGYLKDSNSINLMWRTPLKPNGELDRYEIKYSYTNSHGKRHQKEMKINVGPNQNEKLIQGLKFYSDYFFEVRPCIKLSGYGQRLCGNTWAALSIKTGIGGK